MRSRSSIESSPMTICAGESAAHAGSSPAPNRAITRSRWRTRMPSACSRGATLSVARQKRLEDFRPRGQLLVLQLVDRGRGRLVHFVEVGAVVVDVDQSCDVLALRELGAQ